MATYHEPETLDAATSLMAESPAGTPVAGGTDLVVGARSGKQALPDVLIALHRVQELEGISGDGGGLRCGALVTHADLEASPVVRHSYSALADAAALVGSPATRHVGTLGGNLCNGSPAMESGSPLLVFDASVELSSEEGRRAIPLGDFLRGPASTALARGELLTGVVCPPVAGRSGSAYVRIDYRRGMEIAVVGAAALVSLGGDGRCVEARIALTAVAPTCIRVPTAEEALRGSDPAATAIDEAAAAARAAARPIDDVRAPAHYRAAMVPVAVRRAIEAAVTRARDGSRA
jgi:CO/xanthine dehydrogenase FAD-binding subunit